MQAIIFSVIASSLIFVIFKLFKKFKIDTFQAVVFNYFSAFACGYLSFKQDFSQDWDFGNWWYYAFILGTLFITIFNMMGKSSQSNGIGLTSIATKMSLLISIIFTIIYYQEETTLYKVLGIVFALTSIVLISFPKKGAKLKESSILLIIFFGSGLIEIIIGYCNKSVIAPSLQSVFTATSFLCAGVIGVTILLIQYISKKRTFEFKNLLAGLLLGIPNFYSIYFIFDALKTAELDPSTIFGIINISVVLLSFAIGLVFFREKVKLIHIIGVITAVTAIYFFADLDFGTVFE